MLPLPTPSAFNQKTSQRRLEDKVYENLRENPGPRTGSSSKRRLEDDEFENFQENPGAGTQSS